MANPVFDRLETEWARTTPPSRTPNGYPTMPGYQPGQAHPSSTGGAVAGNVPEYASQNPQGNAGAPVPGNATSAEDMRSFEHMMSAPSADAVDRGALTYDDVIVKTGISLLLLLAGATVGGWLCLTNPGLAVVLAAGGSILALVVALVNTFSKTIRPAMVLLYAVLEGLALGAISMVLEAVFPGIVIQAVLATLVVFLVTLGLFASGKVRNSPKLARFALISLIGIVVYRLAAWVLSFVAPGLIGGFESMSILGIPLGVIIGVFAVFVGAVCLIQDFDNVREGVERAVPRSYAWSCAFGLMLTIVWMYVEILRILSYLRSE
ncbi:Bax inhibitor-1/YccA family protein [Schaalia sp. ZJ405]|uniref:Bax inhibitor-1/YccA family protein n=1 Tax=unclassified Schaalia TaxID=2691889 RepID=UPI0013ECB36D|nr:MULTISPECIES: Bax inhibitor-1/YccA family protein [unclassified Schaalia]QPK80869.1 Bax inhibitor-1/YccA family protein [Schaalia sp. ZJ405]